MAFGLVDLAFFGCVWLNLFVCVCVCLRAVPFGCLNVVSFSCAIAFGSSDVVVFLACVTVHSSICLKQIVHHVCKAQPLLGLSIMVKLLVNIRVVTNNNKKGC